jgi:hypothetical protein
MVKQKIDVICLQEIMKAHFSVTALRNLVGVEFFLELDFYKRAFWGYSYWCKTR